MCGIIGYYGPDRPVDVILDGLKKLEYRGYDSAGLTTLHRGVFKRIRAQGKLIELEKKLAGEVFDGQLGIGHTRWATHGAPTERNAHPHCAKGVSIVHNGVIENYIELREELCRLGVSLESDTDSELIAHLMAQQIDKGLDLVSGAMAVVEKITGAYSVLAISEDHPHELVAFKKGPPLIVGLGKDFTIVASDILAIAPHTKQVLYINDEEVVHIQKTEVHFFQQGEREEGKKRLPTILDWSEERAEKQGYSHFMLKEIYEQPRAVAAAIAPHIDIETKSIRLSGVGFSCETPRGAPVGTSCESLGESSDGFHGGGIEFHGGEDIEKDLACTHEVLKSVERVFIVACGTSFYAGLMGEYIIESLVGLPVEVDVASEFRYRHPIIPKNSLVILISQSGETADSLAALRLVKESQPRILTICNVKNSTMDRESEGRLYMNAGIEVGVASTKALTCTLAILHLLALQMAKAHGRLARVKEQESILALLEISSHMENILAYDHFFSEAAQALTKYKGFLYIGRGIHYPVAMEGALKLKELAYMHAEGYAAGEMKHGPLALIDKNMAIVALAPSDTLYEKTMSNIEESRARGGQLISIGTGDNIPLKALSEEYLSLPKVPWSMVPFLELIPLQLLAFHVAHALGHNVDQPRNLAKSVTVE